MNTPTQSITDQQSVKEFKPGKYRMGRCFVIVTIDAGLWHLSISTKDQLPSYKEMKEARYKYLPNEIYAAEIFPPKEEFVNVMPYCRHLFEIDKDKSNYSNPPTFANPHKR